MKAGVVALLLAGCVAAAVAVAALALRGCFRDGGLRTDGGREYGELAAAGYPGLEEPAD